MKKIDRKGIIEFLVGLLFLIIPQIVFAQQTVVKGKITNASNGDPVPFANVYFKGTTIGTVTDFDGYFQVSTEKPLDTLVVSYMGYITKEKNIERGVVQTLNIQLEEDVVNLEEVVFVAEENPAFAIMRNVIKNKKSNDLRSLDSYEYESYTKIEVDVDNISDKFKEKKIVKKITAVIDSIEQIAGEDGQPVLPMLFSEAISRYYYKKNPTFRHEEIIKTKISGVGITDGTLTSQIIGSSFQQYNFYQNWLSILEKEFVSPITDSWKVYYEYYLVDSLYLGDDFCYRLDIFPKSSQDLAFRGSIWITKNEYALKQIDVSVDKVANLNYIEKIKIQQELTPSSSGPWIPEKTRVLIDVGQVTKQSAGLLAKFYVSNKDIIVNQPKEDKFYELPIVMKEGVRDYDDNYWELNRHDSISSTELHVYQMIDTLKKIPVIRTYTELAKFMANTYIPWGLVELGPYTTWLSKNNIEGYRLGFGFRTNMKFSDKWVFQLYGAYGFDDAVWKYDFSVKRIIKRDPWTTIKVLHKKEIDPVWILSDEISNQSLFYSYSRFGTLSDPFTHTTSMLEFETQTGPGWVNKIILKHQMFNPLFDFSYITNPNDPIPVYDTDFTTSEIKIESRYGKDEQYIINDNERLSLGTVRYPSFTFGYTAGLSNIAGGDFSYHKFHLRIRKTQKLGFFGYSGFTLNGGYILGALPYPLLRAHVGNESPIYISFAYNLMDYYEFSSDHYASLRWRHHFEGFLLNRIPLLKKLKWRMTTTADVLYGGMRDENLKLIPYKTDLNGNQIFPFRTLEQKPYIELGYGVENIFKIFRVDFFHRMSYLDTPGVRKFGIKFSMQFIL